MRNLIKVEMDFSKIFILGGLNFRNDSKDDHNQFGQNANFQFILN